jgi:hypothetical protein
LTNKAGDHSGEESIPLQTFKMKRMPKGFTDEADEGKLGTAIPLAKWVDCVEFA